MSSIIEKAILSIPPFNLALQHATAIKVTSLPMISTLPFWMICNQYSHHWEHHTDIEHSELPMLLNQHFAKLEILYSKQQLSTQWDSIQWKMQLFAHLKI